MIGRVGDADVEVREGRLDDVAEEDFQILFVRCGLHALCEFGGHTGIHFDGCDGAGGAEDEDCEIAGSGTDFEDVVGLFEVGFCDDGRCDLLRD